MNFVNKINRWILNFLGLDVRQKVSPRPKFQDTTVLDYQNKMFKGLERFANLGYSINTVVDVGAAEGKWSLLARDFFPAADFVLFEPLQEREAQLQDLVRNSSKFFHIPKAAGKDRGFVTFAVTADLDGSGVTFEGRRDDTREVEVVPIDLQLRELKLSGPYIVKLDTHGYEVPILEGCREIFHQVHLFIIECYGFEIVKGSLLFWEMCNKMDGYGFRVFDIVDVMHRGNDGAFWQCDIFFIRKDHKLFLDNQYAS